MKFDHIITHTHICMTHVKFFHIHTHTYKSEILPYTYAYIHIYNMHNILSYTYTCITYNKFNLQMSIFAKPPAHFDINAQNSALQ